MRTTLGPRAMLKMLLDPMGGIALTNDGNAILREIDVTHPAAKVRETQGATSRDLMISNVLPLQTVSGVVDQNLS